MLKIKGLRGQKLGKICSVWYNFSIVFLHRVFVKSLKNRGMNESAMKNKVLKNQRSKGKLLKKLRVNYCYVIGCRSCGSGRLLSQSSHRSERAALPHSAPQNIDYCEKLAFTPGGLGRLLSLDSHRSVSADITAHGSSKFCFATCFLFILLSFERMFHRHRVTFLTVSP